MRRWTSLAPYNAGHVIRVSGAPDLERWRTALTRVLSSLGLREPVPLELKTLELDEIIVEELNRPFAPGSVPLRSFVLDQRNNHSLGLTYDHWFADSPSLRAFMQRAFAHYAGLEQTLPPLRLADDEGLPQSRFDLQALAFCIRNYLRHRRAYRVHLRDPLDFNSGFFSTRFPDGVIDEIRAFAKRCNATVNDVFLAAAFQVLEKFAREQQKLEPSPRAKRDRIAIATAVDLNPVLGGQLDDVFGFSVGYFTTVCDHSAKLSLAELVAATARETSASKSAAYALEFTWSLRLVRWIWDRSSQPRFKAQLFQKGLPFLAGISNVNLTGSWVDQDSLAADSGPIVLDYLRVSPVGALAPLVFTLTTIRNRLSLCVTYRTTAFSQEQAERITADFMRKLEQLE